MNITITLKSAVVTEYGTGSSSVYSYTRLPNGDGVL